VDQCANFPNIKNDDDVDSFMLAMEEAVGGPRRIYISDEMLARV
jgi:phage terminase large subunit-like protein